MCTRGTGSLIASWTKTRVSLGNPILILTSLRAYGGKVAAAYEDKLIPFYFVDFQSQGISSVGVTS